MPDIRHGTHAGYQTETRLRLGHCEPCRTANREYLRDWRRQRKAAGISLRRYTLTICAAGYDRPDLPLVVCGLPPGHRGAHHDVNWPVAWAEEQP